jgi:tetratricopeptide (TPR) repeat protein
MSSSDNQIRPSQKIFKVYVILTVVFLFLLALLSSLGIAFVYIFGGAAGFCAFMAYQNRPLAPHRFTYPNSDKKKASSFSEKVRDSFRATSGSPTSQTIRLPVIVIGAIASFIFFVVLIVIFSDEPVDENGIETGTATDLYNQGDYEGAYAIYKRQLVEEGASSDAYYGIGNIKSMLGEIDSALYYYSESLRVNPSKYEAAYGKALVYFNEKRYDESLRELQYIFNQNDSYVDAILLAGDNYYLQNQYPQAIRYYESAYELGARSKELLNIMGYIYDNQGQPEKAIRYYKETLQYDSALTDVVKRLGELLPGDEGEIYRRKASGENW